MKRKYLPAVVLASLVSWGCGPEAPADSDADTPPEPPPVNVTVVTLEPETLEDALKLSGRLEPWVEVHVSTELGGTVQEIDFDKGQHVRRGQVLARIGTDLFEAALAEAQAELQHAEAEYKKTTELFNRQAVPRQELTAATSNYLRAQARVEQGRLRVERSIIKAPISGVAIVREIEVGEVVPAGSLLTTIDDLSRLKADIGIPENDIASFSVGERATIEVDAFPKREFEGKLHFVSPAASGANRTFPAEVALDNQDGLLRPGMIVRVKLVKQVYENRIVVPRDAVLERDSGPVAFVVRGERAELRRLRTGASEAGRIVILEGLEAGDELIVTGQRNLVDGQRVSAVHRDARLSGESVSGDA